MPLVQMPAPRADEERRRLRIELVLPAIRIRKRNRAAHRIVEGLLTFNDVAPRWGRGVLQIGHEDLGAGVEGVDDHLAVARPGDLDAAIVEVGGGGRDLPVGVPYLPRLG